MNDLETGTHNSTRVARLFMVALVVGGLAACHHKDEPVDLRYESSAQAVIEQVLRDSYPDYGEIGVATRCVRDTVPTNARDALADTSGSMIHEDKRALVLSYASDAATSTCLTQAGAPLL